MLSSPTRSASRRPCVVSTASTPGADNETPCCPSRSNSCCISLFKDMIFTLFSCRMDAYVHPTNLLKSIMASEVSPFCLTALIKLVSLVVLDGRRRPSYLSLSTATHVGDHCRIRFCHRMRRSVERKRG